MAIVLSPMGLGQLHQFEPHCNENDIQIKLKPSSRSINRENVLVDILNMRKCVHKEGPKKSENGFTTASRFYKHFNSLQASDAAQPFLKKI